ncbi:LarC family nickel insertion protein [Ancylobacter dichloromethanicus]|uniref:LarC family nickel insertion protein n=2 Tax=Ancylobacter dichloromethanicus TaxID=518825 RepID=UPI0022F2E0A6|nr:LarC family nickel insertion protein [Ancylobacter dichloromethanicus]
MNSGGAISGGARRIHLDAVGGVAGDMFVAALLDAFPDLAPRVMADARAVLPEGAGTPVLREGLSGGIAVRRFGLEGEDAHTHAHDHAHRPAHSHAHQASGAVLAEGLGPRAKPGNEEERGGNEPAHERHRHGAGSYRDMRARIEAAALSEGTARHASAILGLLARAEAAIHGVKVEEVHFHEIADWDSLLDVVAAGSLAAALQGADWTVSALPLGGGLVRTQHGLLPVPAPATAALLDGFDWRDDGIAGERVTPTGAAILKHLARPGRPLGGRLVASGTGAGTRALPGMPNVLRALVFEAAPAEGDARADHDRVAVIEFDIDDMTGEEIGTASERLRAAPGVLDVSVGSRLGKKGRPVASMRLLARPESMEAVARACFAQTSTIGLRVREERRLILPRAAGESAGVAVKTVARPGGPTVKAESDVLTGDTLAARRALKLRAESGDAERGDA